MNDSINIRNGCRFLLALLLLILLLFAGCTAAEGGQNGEQMALTVPSETAQSAAETEPAPTAPPNGDPTNVTCRGSYTVTEPLTDQQANRPIAVAGGQSLSNGALQVYYWMEIARYLEENPGVTFSQPLDTLLCDIDDTAVTWQQYFLQRALHTWFTRQAVYLHSVNTPMPTEEAYQPNAENHEKNRIDDMPAVDYLYGYVHRSFVPNDMHQAYLDNLPALLDALAAEQGFADGETMAREVMGARGEDLAAYARLYNWDYMYYTQLTYDMEPTEEMLIDYLRGPVEEPAAEGEETEPTETEPVETAPVELPTGIRESVTVRQILLLPENAVVAADGTVTAEAEDWEDCLAEAQGVLYNWRTRSANAKKYYPRPDNVDEALFAEKAIALSADGGSRADGGLYSNLKPGQLPAALDSWCFDGVRQNGDAEIFTTEYGIHILYFVSAADSSVAQLRSEYLKQQTSQLLEAAMTEYTMIVDYNSIRLREPGDDAVITDELLLYPDVAHERYPTAPLYFQQDYPDTRYGQYPIASYGCGVTTLSMLASYMTDEEYTPPELCKRYGYYCMERGTNPPMFEETPAELGFYYVERTLDWEKVLEALNRGQVVVSLQKTGYWTGGGHFILLEKVTEDGLIQVRDSNLFNYGKLSGHQIDAHEASVITPKSSSYWIYYPKVVRTAACHRCDDTGYAQGENTLITGDYTCARCTAAMERRNNFMEAMEALCG
jgi:hypothetical protein